jgi:hypothetical protein
MTKQEIIQLIKKYIGVSEGYLCDFTKRSHEEFYAEFCNLDIDATLLTGTTREKFQHILTNSPPDVQAKIIRGVLAKCPPVEGHELRTQEAHDNFLRIAQRLEGIARKAKRTRLDPANPYLAASSLLFHRHRRPRADTARLMNVSPGVKPGRSTTPALGGRGSCLVCIG